MDEKEQQRKDIFDRLEKLSPELKDVMFSGVTAEKMFDIGKRYGLLVDKVGEMAHETGLLMLGVTHPDEFIGNLAARLEVDTQKANVIADDINREIFSPVREHLRAVFGGISGQGEPPTNKIPRDKSTPPLKKGGVGGDLQSISIKPELQASGFRLQEKSETTLEDLEAELEHALAGQKGEHPLSVVRQQPSETISKAQDTYKGADPYREQIEEHMPNTQGVPYVPPNENNVVHNKYQEKEEPKPIKEISIATPTPKPVEEPSVFSPLSPESSPKENDISQASGFKLQASESDPYRENFTQEDTTGVKNGSLQAFRGFNMNNLPKQQSPNKNQEKEEQQPQQQKPVNEPSDLPRYGFSKQPPYREKPEA